MLGVLRRAALLVQLQQIATSWNSTGKGSPMDVELLQAPGLNALSMTKILRLQRMLHRQDTSLRDVLFGLESALRYHNDGQVGDGGDGDTGRLAAPPSSSSSATAASAMVDGDDSTRTSVVRASERHRRELRGSRRGRDSSNSNNNRAVGDLPSSLRSRGRQHRLRQTIAEVATLASAAGELEVARSETTLTNPSSGAADQGDQDVVEEECTPPSTEVEKAGTTSFSEEDDTDVEDCHICMDAGAEVAFQPCSHSICFQCACRLCMRCSDSATCPFCRRDVEAVVALPGARSRKEKSRSVAGEAIESVDIRAAEAGQAEWEHVVVN